MGTQKGPRSGNPTRDLLTVGQQCTKPPHLCNLLCLYDIMSVNIDATARLLQACAEQRLLLPEVAEDDCMDSELQPPLTSI